MDRIGIIGGGSVGNAVAKGFEHAYTPVIYDKYKAGTVNSIDELVRQCGGVVFVCVPTPMTAYGGCDTSIVDEVVSDICNCEASKYTTPIDSWPTTLRPTIVIKSTVCPGTCARLAKEYGRIVFNPEFLYENNAVEDFQNQTRIILGGDTNHLGSVNVVQGLYEKAFPGVPIVRTDYETAEMVKYVTNCYLAVKVALANELSQVCERLGVDYPTMIKIAKLDGRLGDTHWRVPGENGLFGFGKACLPKDLNGLIYLARSLGVDTQVMDGAWRKNLEVRPERDWETQGVVF